MTGLISAGHRVLAGLLPGYALARKGAWARAVVLLACVWLTMGLLGHAGGFNRPGMAAGLWGGLWFGAAWLGAAVSARKTRPPLNAGRTMLGLTLFALIVAASPLLMLVWSKPWLGYRLVHVGTPSMWPTIRPGDFIWVQTGGFTRDALETGMVVVFPHPYQRERRYIKRVAALAGESFQGKPVSAGQVAVLGDQSDNSEDSRHFGAIAVTSIEGIARWQVVNIDVDGRWSWARLGRALGAPSTGLP